MRVLTGFSVMILLGAGTIAPPAAKAQGGQQESVAEAARKARAQKKAPAKPVRVYTEEELAREKAAQQGEPGAISTVGVEQPETKAEGKEAAKDSGKSGGEAAKKEKGDESQEQMWRERFKGARENLERAEKELDILQREEAKARVQNYSDPNQALKEGFEQKEINEKKAKIEEKTKEIEKLRQALSDLEDDLRKAGGDPAWAR